jgi:hypothetical protein
VGIGNCTKPPPGIKVDSHGYQKINCLVIIYNLSYQKIKYPNTIRIHGSQFFEKNSNIHLTMPSLFRFFRETRRLFEVSEIPKTGSSLLLNFFSNTQNRRFFESEFFQIPGTGGYHKNQIPHTGHDVMTRVKFLYKKTGKKKKFFI